MRTRGTSCGIILQKYLGVQTHVNTLLLIDNEVVTKKVNIKIT